ncbi:unnamed protein product, partial [Vitis vinifera]|uniref:Uncharacterized protein n=1 Tax=Vitis vinifera TaxID=29760 RepID=D7T4F8_VITVI
MGVKISRNMPFWTNPDQLLASRQSTMDHTSKTGALVDVDGEEGFGKWKNMSKEVEDEEDSWKLGKFHDHGMKTPFALDVHGIA